MNEFLFDEKDYDALNMKKSKEDYEKREAERKKTKAKKNQSVQLFAKLSKFLNVVSQKESADKLDLTCKNQKTPKS